MTLNELLSARKLLLAWLLLAMLVPAAAADIDRQRELFMRVYEQVELGRWDVVDALDPREQRLLSAYVLWPDLRAAYFRATLGRADATAVESFLDEFSGLRPARELRYRYAIHLAESGELPAFLSLYQQFYQGLEIARLDCFALRAEIAAGKTERVFNRATALWMVGSSQAAECDPVFDFLRDRGALGRSEYAERFELAIAAREFYRARWLARSLDAAHVEIAERWIQAQSNPESFVNAHPRAGADTGLQQQLVYAIERITYTDPAAAQAHWKALQRHNRFPERQALQTARHIALWTARDRLPGAYELLGRLPAAAQNDEVHRWRARTSLANGDWAAVLQDIAAMSAAERDSEEWRYWRAIALQAGKQVEAANALLAALALERSYYGFLAADELGLDYALGHSRIDADEAVIAALEARAELVRARELFLVGLDSRGRSEWDKSIELLSAQEKLQAALLAGRWGWHSRAIATAASAGDYDDLALRYPLPFEKAFAESSALASIATPWAYGIARSESLFMHDVRSSAGAVGLMQLMPTTGKMVATQAGLPYAGLATLTDPELNIRLGTSYLGQMMERFGGNRVLATAAYNAGPGRVESWLPATGRVDARIWIEAIPFNETRSYVRRVMAAETIFYWRMTGQTRRLSDTLVSVQALQPPEQLARN